jgi:predicted  nucleic acid-binding Zn-ribbon protein
MHSDLNKLMDLQQVDSRIAALESEVAGLPVEVRRIEARLAASKGHVEAVQAAMKVDENARRKHESDIQDQQQKISKYRDQSLAVKTNQEYKALLSEIEQAEAEIRKLEDKILEIMVAADARKEDLRQAEAALKADTVQVEKEKEHARQQTAEDEKQLAELNAQRQELRRDVNDDALRHYDRVMKLRHSALSAVHDDQMCSVCRVILRPQVYQNVVKGEEMVYCDSCQRILYFVPPPPEAEGEAEPERKKRKSKGVTETPQEEPTPADEAAAQ